MRREVVGKLVLIATQDQFTPVHVPGLTALIVAPLLKSWLDSRVLCLLVWAICTGFLISAMWGSGATALLTVGLPVLLTTLLFICPWLYLRWRFRVHHRTTLRALEKVFADERVTIAEWADAKRLIRPVKPELLRYGATSHFDHLCAL